MLTKTHIPFKNRPASLHWHNDHLIDWLGGGRRYHLDGTYEDSCRRFAYRFDAAIANKDGTYSILYERLGTKALLIKGREVVRELNRSYYQANEYEFPIAFFRLPDGRDALLHCPDEYFRLEIELVENGRRISCSENREDIDYFQSRLAVSPNGKYALSAGWYWHPWDSVAIIDLERALGEPSELDSLFCPRVSTEIGSASFIDDRHVLVATNSDKDDDGDFSGYPPNELPPGHMGIYDLQVGAWRHMIHTGLSHTNIRAIDMDYAWDILGHPKIIDLGTGKTIASCPDLDSGNQCSSIFFGNPELPPLALHPDRRQLAAGTGEGITLLHFTPKN